MAKPKEVGLWEGLDWKVVALLVGVVGLVLFRPQPKTDSRRVENRTKTAQIRKNIVRTTQTTFPDGKAVKTQIIDLSTVDSDQKTNTVSSSMTWSPMLQYGVSVGFDPVQREMWYGGEYRFLGPLWFEAESNLKDRLILKGSVKF